AAQLFVLQQLRSAGGALTPGELAERTLTHQSSVSVVARRLMDGGLVKRRWSPADGRRVELSLTPAGRAAVRRRPRLARPRRIHLRPLHRHRRPFRRGGPIIATGGAVGSLVGQLLHTTAVERKTLLAAGAAAGMDLSVGRTPAPAGRDARDRAEPELVAAGVIGFETRRAAPSPGVAPRESQGESLQCLRTFCACNPFGPLMMSNSTRSPSLSERKPSIWMAV